VFRPQNDFIADFDVFGADHASAREDAGAGYGGSIAPNYRTFARHGAMHGLGHRIHGAVVGQRAGLAIFEGAMGQEGQEFGEDLGVLVSEAPKVGVRPLAHLLEVDLPVTERHRQPSLGGPDDGGVRAAGRDEVVGEPVGVLAREQAGVGLPARLAGVEGPEIARSQRAWLHRSDHEEEPEQHLGHATDDPISP